MKKSVFNLITAFVVAIFIFGSIPMIVSSSYGHCSKSGCTRKKSTGSIYCYEHKLSTTSSSSSSYSSKKSYSSSRKKYDSYDVYNYRSSQDFADDKYEEFFDYEDDFEDEDEAYDAAEDYWNDHH